MGLGLVDAAGVTECGPVRQINEDALVCDSTLGLFAVADGMGGHRAGEVASRLAVEALVTYVRQSASEPVADWPYGHDATLSVDANRLRTAIHLANHRVVRASDSREEYAGMGTTIVSLLLGARKAIVGHVGDSRLYLSTGGRLTQLTRDDSWMTSLLQQQPELDAEALRNHPMRNVLTNVLGARDQTEVHILEQEVRGETVLLLSSDGLHGILRDEVLAGRLSGGGSAGAMARDLVTAALQAGSRDNVTAVVVKLMPGD